MLDGLVQLECLRVTVVVDNETDGLSPPCGCCESAHPAAAYASEVSAVVAQVIAGTAPDLDFTAICHAGHGYSLLLEAQTGDGTTRRLLFDGGPSTDLFRRNAASLAIPLADVEAAVLSHWHVDHSVGLVAAAEDISKALAGSSSSSSSSTESPGEAETSSTGRSVVFDLHAHRPHRRGLQLPQQQIVPFNSDPELSAFALPGIDVQLHTQEHTLLGGCFYVSGSIPRVTEYETGNPQHASQWEPGGEWVTDMEIADERYVAAAVRGRGFVVFSACSHAGIVNVMRDVQQKCGGVPPYAVFGGFHLAPRDTLGRIAPTVADMAALHPALVVGGHCTGWRAKAALTTALGERYMPSFVGSRFSVTALPAS